jgi:hypothetical protein
LRSVKGNCFWENFCVFKTTKYRVKTLSGRFKIFYRNCMVYRNETTKLEEEFQIIFVACGRSEATPAITTWSATVVMIIKWRLNARKHFVCSIYISQYILFTS